MTSNNWISAMTKVYLALLAVLWTQSVQFAQPLRSDDWIYSLSDKHDSTATSTSSQLSDDADPEYPQQVCTHPGVPRKPLWDRPGDINQSQCPPIRYGQDDCFRSGWPHSIRKWSTGSINSRYSAWYVGGGSAWLFPHGRGRTCEEGTWGLDYSLWSRPKLVWMNWTRGREQAGLGAYETDH
jgi:hypothetical protein